MIVEPYSSTMVNSYDKTLNIAEKDIVRYKTQGVVAARTLAAYFINIRSSRDTALVYTNRGLAIDSTDAPLKQIKSVLEKSNTRPQRPPGKTTGKPSAAIRKPSNKS